MEINEAKGIVLGTVFILTFLSINVPVMLMKKLHGTIDPIKRHRYAIIISHMSCFAAGVFMATGLLDLFPEVKETVEKGIIIAQVSTTFPIAEFAVSMGFFLVLIIEQIVLDYKENTAQITLIPPAEAEIERRQLQRQGSVEGISDHVHNHEDNLADEPVAHSTLRSLLLLAALSVHSLMEGIAIGLQPNVLTVLQIFLAVVLHKVILSFSLGLNLVQSVMKISSIIKSNLLFCISTPIGIGIAMGLEEFGHSLDSSVVNGILQGLACGTFFYVTFFEVLPHELNHGSNRLTKVLALLFGFSFVCGVLFLEPR